jgi:ribulose-phosphate 3-epimerase
VAEHKIKIAPSILSSDFSRLGDQVAEAEQAGADCIHIDVMDGQFVPPITFGPIVVDAIRGRVSIPLEVHMMTLQPERHLAQLVEAGADRIIVHVEACPHIHAVVQQIKGAGIEAGVAINPGTALSTVETLLPDLDQLLVMTVNPGYGGQSFIPSTLSKIGQTKAMIDTLDHSITLEVDGGINASTIASAVGAGATLLVAGSAVFNPKSSVANALSNLRQAIDAPTSPLDH